LKIGLLSVTLLESAGDFSCTVVMASACFMAGIKDQQKITKKDTRENKMTFFIETLLILIQFLMFSRGEKSPLQILLGNYNVPNFKCQELLKIFCRY